MTDYPIPACPEFRRVDALPRRTYSSEQAEKLARQLTAALRKPGTASAGVSAPTQLKPEQALILLDFVLAGGVYVGGSVGLGKTLAIWLVLLLAERCYGVKRAALLLPAALVKDTLALFRSYAELWQSPKPPTVVTYQQLGPPENQWLLCGCPKCAPDPQAPGLQPDFLAADEADLLRNPDSSVSRRVARFLARHADTVRSAWFTGTPLRHSFRAMARPIIWALKSQAPVPLNWGVTEAWIAALSSDPEQRRPPGALVQWSESSVVSAVRNGVRRRLSETQGVLLFPESSCDQPLTIRVVEVPGTPELDKAFAQFRRDEETPDGWPLGDPLSVLRYATGLSCEFYYRWDPRPPADWLAARTAVNRFVAEQIAKSQRTRRPLDSEGAVFRAYPHAPEIVHWREVKPTFEPRTVAVDLPSVSLMAAVKQWLADPEPGLVWVQHRHLGEKFATAFNLPYFSAKGRAGRIAIKDYLKTKPRSAILSVHANRRGRNLQCMRRNLIVGPEHSAERWEQMLGRTHRYLQTGAVCVTVLVSCAENLVAIEAAREEAEIVESLSGIRQKILHAQWQWEVSASALNPKLFDSADPRKPRWSTRIGVKRKDKSHGTRLTIRNSESEYL